MERGVRRQRIGRTLTSGPKNSLRERPCGAPPPSLPSPARGEGRLALHAGLVCEQSTACLVERPGDDTRRVAAYLKASRCMDEAVAGTVADWT